MPKELLPDSRSGKTSHRLFTRNLSDIDKIKSMSPSKILVLAEQSAEFEAKCKSPELTSFWVNKFQSLFKNFIPYILELDVFTQFRAQYYYHVAVRNHEMSLFGQEETPNLVKAGSFHSFDAIFFMMKQVPSDQLPVILELLSHLNPKHSTPALLLYAQVYLNAALAAIPSKDKSNITLICLEQAFIYLHLAEKMAENSMKEIHNATYGLTLQKIFPGFNSFNDAKSHIIGLFEQQGIYHIPTLVASLIDRASIMQLDIMTIADEERSMPPHTAS